MAETALPYVLNIGTLKKALDKIKEASTPDRFTTDYLSETLGMRGGSARPIIPFLKKTGFLGTDGVPTELYRRFRNPAATGSAAFEALRFGYKPLYAKNETAHKLNDAELKGIVLESTGLDHESRVATAIVASFKHLKSLASFDEKPTLPAVKKEDEQPKPERRDPPPPAAELPVGMNLSYTINLNLPATPDINVFNAIFRSLKENLLKR